MLGRHRKAFAFFPEEIGWVDPKIVEPMEIFTVPHRSREHRESVRKMKEVLAAALALRKEVYGGDIPIYVTVDTSPTGIGWVIN